jgi:hypothetical protein
MKTRFLFLLCLSLPALATEPLAFGLYPAGSRTLANLDIRSASLISQDNANARFQLSLTVPYDAALGPSSYQLVLSDRTFAQNGSGANGTENSSLHFVLEGEANVRLAGELFKTEPIRRMHPGHRLRVEFVPGKAVYAPGEEVTVELRMTNVGSNTVAFQQGGRNRGMRDNQFRFQAMLAGKAVPDIGTNLHFGGLSIRRGIAPGETFSQTISLAPWFALGQAGHYEIQGAYVLEFKDPKDPEAWRTIWEDIAAADFLVRVDAPAGTD